MQIHTHPRDAASELAEGTWRDAYYGRTIVVTGAAGFLGGQLVKHLVSVPCRIVRVALTKQIELEKGGHCLKGWPTHRATVVDVQGDVRDGAVWERVLADADVVFHLAAQTSAEVANQDPASDFEANVGPLRHLLATCRRIGTCPTVVFAGTATQSGVPARLPVDEDAADNPVTAYDMHKLIAESDLKRAASDGSARGVTLRLANVYGPSARAENGRAEGRPYVGGSASRGVLNRMISAALRGEGLTVYGSGEYLRDYLFVDDAIEAFLEAGAHADRVSGRHYVVGSGHGTTIKDAFELVASRVALKTGLRVPVMVTGPRSLLASIERRNFVANPSRFADDTGWRANWALADGIDRTIEVFSCG